MVKNRSKKNNFGGDIGQILKMAETLTGKMSDKEKDMINNLDIDKMVENVSKSVFNSLNLGNLNPNNGNISKDENVKQISNDKKEEQYKVLKTKDLVFNIDVTLEELFSGKKKKINVKRKRSFKQNDGSFKIVEEKKKFTVPIEKGMIDNETIVFKNEADQLPDYESGDIVVILRELPHNVFHRQDSDLFVLKEISVYELFYLDFMFEHLDGRVFRIKNEPSDILCNDMIRKIPNEGMPVYGDENRKRGDLFIRFKLNINTDVLPDKDKLKELFPPFLLDIQKNKDVNDADINNVTVMKLSDEDHKRLEYDEYDDEEYEFGSDDDDEDCEEDEDENENEDENEDEDEDEDENEDENEDEVEDEVEDDDDDVDN